MSFIINDCIGLFQKYFDSLCYPFKVLHKDCFQFFLGAIVNPKGKRTQCLVCKIFKGQQSIMVSFKMAYEAENGLTTSYNEGQKC